MGGRLEFLRNEAGENEGLGDAGIETFRDDPYASCGREAGQNSRDAARGSAPVRMTFDLLEVPSSEFPGVGELKSAIQSCLGEASDDKVRDYFKQAQSLVNAPTIKMLRISDYETKGLVGPPNVPRTAFHSLLKGSGVSSEKSDTSGGSFGIGKNAAFAVSDLRTVFYSTIYENSNKQEVFAAQGKVLLVSHRGADGKAYRAKGYWGDPDGHEALTSVTDVPEWMRRDEIGTSIFSAGFRVQADWAHRIAYALLANFFVAIEVGEMEFEIDGKLKINASTIGALFDDEDIRSAADEAGRLDDFLFSASLHRCLCSHDAVVVPIEVPGLGEVSLRVLMEEGLVKRVGIVRNGMLITTGLEHFGDKLIRFAGKDFVALVRPNEEASRLLKRLENPRHDSFSANRIDDPAKRAAADAAMRLLGRKLRAAIKDIIAVEAGDEVLLEELADFFGEDASDNRPPDPKAEPDPERFIYEPPVVRRKRRQSSSSTGGARGGGGTREGDNQRTEGGGAGAGGGEGGSGSAGPSTEVYLSEVRNMLPSSDGTGQSRVLYFTPETSGVVEFQVAAKGVFGDQALEVSKSDNGSPTKAGKVKLSVVAGVRTKITLQLKHAYRGPIEVEARLVEGVET